MKKIFLMLAACAGVLTSCDMNTTQYGVIDDSAELDFQYVTQLRTYSTYSYLRSASVGSWLYDVELQCDQFIGLVSNGSRGQNISNGQINSTNNITGGAFDACYTRIAQINYAIEQIDGFTPSGTNAAEEAFELIRYRGETHFSRAWHYFYLFDHYCPTYTKATANEAALGLQLVTKYEPTGDTSKYPGRSTQQETVDLINSDLQIAFDALAIYENGDGTMKGNTAFTVAGANYLSTYAVAALQARVALVTGDYAAAIDKADYVISNPSYSLAVNTDYLNMWKDQNVQELIFTPYYVAAEIGTQAYSTNQGWNYWWADPNQCDYIPTQETIYALAEYENTKRKVNDIRFQAFLGSQRTINVGDGATAKGYAFQKFPGNKSLNSSTTDFYINTGKPFRLSEQYLIKAEAAALSQKDDIAKEAIDALVKARLIDQTCFVPTSLAGSQLLDFIRYERSKELIGEGFRLSDLRRWKVAFDRNQPYEFNQQIADARWTIDLAVKYTADDHRYVWPIPSSEMEINPQLAGQQNRGY